MAPRPKRRDQWRQTKLGTWTFSLGNRGKRVRLFQKRKDGFFHREIHLPGGRKDRRSLGTRDRQAAEQMGTQLLVALLQGSVPTGPRVLRFGTLAEAFLNEAPKHLDNAARTRSDYASRIALLRAVIGDQRDVHTLSAHDVDQYVARRRAGGIRYGDGRVSAGVRQRSAQADVKLLKQVLNWACSRSYPDGERWLGQNPLSYVPVRSEPDVQRPVATTERFVRTRQAMRESQVRYEQEAARATNEGGRERARARQQTWIGAELGLMLLEATGRRRGAIMGLQWSDFDFDREEVTWRGAHDKKGRTGVVPYPPDFFAEVRAFQRRLGAAGGFLFPRRGDATRPAPSELLSQWVRTAEVQAGLPKLRGGITHPYRRKWRTERSHDPIKAVAVAGGWTDYETMFRSYDVPDRAAVLAVTRRPVREQAETG